MFSPVLSISGQKFPQYFEKFWKFFAAFQTLYFFISRFLAKLLTMFFEYVVWVRLDWEARNFLLRINRDTNGTKKKKVKCLIFTRKKEVCGTMCVFFLSPSHLAIYNIPWHFSFDVKLSCSWHSCSLTTNYPLWLRQLGKPYHNSFIQPLHIICHLPVSTYLLPHPSPAMSSTYQTYIKHVICNLSQNVQIKDSQIFKKNIRIS